MKEIVQAFQQLLEIDETDLRNWGMQKAEAARRFDLEFQFELDKTSKLLGKPISDRLLLLPIPGQSKIVPIRVKLRFVSGVKWLILKNFEGKLPTFHGSRQSPEIDQQTTPVNSHISDEATMKKLRHINTLYLKMHTDSSVANDLVSICSFDQQALEEMGRIFHFGSREVQKVFSEAYSIANGHPFETVLKGVRDDKRNGTRSRSSSEVSTGDYDADNTAAERIFHDDTYEISASEDPSTEKKDTTNILDEIYMIDPTKETEIPRIKTDIGFDFRLQGIGLDIVDSKTCRDVMYISLVKICVSAEILSGDDIRLLLSVGWCQIDNALKDAFYPTILRPIVDLHQTAHRSAALSFTSQKERDNKARPRVVFNLPGQPLASNHFRFNDSSLFDDDLSARFQAPSNFEVFRLAVENKIGSRVNQSLADEPLTRFIHFTQALSEKHEKRKRREIALADPNEHAGRSPFVVQLNACDLPPSPSLSGSSLIDIPLCIVEAAPLAVSVDQPIINSTLMLVDNALVSLEEYCLNVVTGDAVEIQQSENEIQSAAWREYLGGAEVLFSQRAVLARVSITTLDVGAISLVLNVDIGGYSKARKFNSRSEPRRTVAKGQMAFHDIDEGEEEPFEENGDVGVDRNDKRPRQMAIRFAKENENPWVSATGDLTPGGQEHLQTQQPETEVVKAILSALKLHTSLSDAQIKLSKMQYRDLAGPSDELALEIISPYITNVARQIAGVIGAIDLLGNPSLVLRHILRGVRRSGTVSNLALECLRP